MRFRITVFDKIDFVVSLACLALLFGGLLFLPLWAFWFWFVPLAAFWLRYNWVMLRYD